jgi:hypothetical protein
MNWKMEENHMCTKNKMIELSREKDCAVDISDDVLLKETNSKLYSIKRHYIEKWKLNIKEGNYYKKYLEENRDYIKSRYALNIMVKTTEEAIMVLQEKVDMRVLFGIDVQYMEIFQSELFFKEEDYEGIEATEEEADRSMAHIINSKDGFSNIDYAVEENIALGMWRYRVAIYTEKLQAYIAYNREKKIERYYLKANSKTDDYSYDMYFDSIELFEICMKSKNEYSAIKELCRLLNIEIEYETNQLKKYSNNLKLLQEYKMLEIKCPNLYNCLQNHSELLKVINLEGSEYINNSADSYMGQNIFSFSNEFIGIKAVSKGEPDMKMKYAKGTVNPKLTLYCILGLLIKIPLEELTKKYRYRAFKFDKEENSYIVPLYTEEVLMEAEQRLKILKEAKVKPTKINGDICRAIFGEEIFRSVYGNYYKVSA